MASNQFPTRLLACEDAPIDAFYTSSYVDVTYQVETRTAVDNLEETVPGIAVDTVGFWLCRMESDCNVLSVSRARTQSVVRACQASTLTGSCSEFQGILRILHDENCLESNIHQLTFSVLEANHDAFEENVFSQITSIRFSQPETESSSELSAGGIAAIVLACIMVASASIFFLWFFKNRRSGNANPKASTIQPTIMSRNPSFSSEVNDDSSLSDTIGKNYRHDLPKEKQPFTRIPAVLTYPKNPSLGQSPSYEEQVSLEVGLEGTQQVVSSDKEEISLESKGHVQIHGIAVGEDSSESTGPNRSIENKVQSSPPTETVIPQARSFVRGTIDPPGSPVSSTGTGSLEAPDDEKEKFFPRRVVADDDSEPELAKYRSNNELSNDTGESEDMVTLEFVSEKIDYQEDDSAPSGEAADVESTTGSRDSYMEDISVLTDEQQSPKSYTLTTYIADGIDFVCAENPRRIQYFWKDKKSVCL